MHTLPPDDLLQRLADLEARLQRFEDTQAIRDCVLRYMDLCDHLDAHTPMHALGDCFTEDALWAGKGARYGASFGGHQGRDAIVAMLGRYRGSLAGEQPARAPHFAFNAHFLTSEQIRPTGPHSAEAAWLMLQTSSFSAGGAHLNAARLSLQMQRGADGRWRIARFETENLLSRPVSTWHSDAALPVPAPDAMRD
ncbi:nuclear transport factor 2 family protein [Aquabacterium sp. OR-4]|uniref:nuclear transport factor 2 family protein n=1 Tax=Aquabacterium sp. OR-4 TaxID=2978127 RepID=UPI0028CA15EF|nr:nuclear transport factor 2 family protein [Aquabacterium sp. OR-4]MDT7839031.1 nuclear transport factor 2 family protein [Aquabacterium sp. OR-4]